MILSAKEVRYMADNYYTNNFPYIMKSIKHEAHRGNYTVTISEKVPREVYNKLIELGYIFKEDLVNGLSIIEW